MTAVMVTIALNAAPGPSAVEPSAVELVHFLKKQSEQRVPRLCVRMSVGGLVVVARWKLVAKTRHSRWRCLR